MRASIVAGAVLLFAGTAHPAWTDEKKDAQLSEELQGAWNEKLVMSNGAVANARTVFIKGGRLNLLGSVSLGGRSIPIIASGTWKVKNGYLHYKIEKSNLSAIIPNGFTSADKILRVSRSEFVYVDSSTQKTMIAKRVK